MSKKDVFITHEGDIPNRWLADAERRIAAHTTTRLTKSAESADVVVFFSDKLVQLSQLASRYPHSTLLVISPSITDISPTVRSTESTKMGHLPLTGNSAAEIIGALSDLHVIPDITLKL